MTARRLGTMAVVLLFVGGCGVWLNYVPYVPGRLLVAIPAEASWVSTHRDLDDRWDEVVANPLVQTLAGESLAERGDQIERLRTLLGRESVVAYVPQIGSRREPAWFVVSWIGARSFQLQWWLNLRPGEAIERHPVHRGRNYWTVQGHPVAFAFEEGMLIACISDDAEAILYSMMCFDGSLPSVDQMDDGRRSWLVSEGAADRGWYRGWTAETNHGTRYEATEVARDRMQVTVRLPVPLAAGRADGDPSMAAAVQPLFGDLPAGLIHASADALDVVLGPWASASWATELRTVLREAGGQRVLVGLFGGEYSGRLQGVRVPALVVAAPVEDESRALRAVASALHRLNAQHDWGLLMKGAPGGSNGVYLVDSGLGTAYAEQPVDEKVAFGVEDGCLLVASNYDTLSRLIARRQWATAPPLSSTGGLWQVARESVPLAGSFDLERSGKAIRNGVAVYAMTQMMSGGPAANVGQARAERIKQGVMGIQPFLRGRCRLESGPDGAVLTLELGPDE